MRPDRRARQRDGASAIEVHLAKVVSDRRMCLVVYLAASSPLPLIEWRDDAPAFNIQALSEADEPVREKLALPVIVYAGSHTGCGCGFSEGRGEWLDGSEAEERAASLTSSASLVAYIIRHGVVELYVCWAGDVSVPVESERRIRIEELIAPEFAFKEREKLVVIEGDVP